MVKVSIIMPSLNVTAYIEECISSVMRQSLQEIEIISIDAGSTDGTVEIIKKLAKTDDRFVLLKSDIKSYGHQVNIGISVARGEYIAILETDDFVAEDMYGTLYGIAKEKQLDFVMADYSRFYLDEDGSKVLNKVQEFADESGVYKTLLDDSFFRGNMIPNPNLWRGIYRTSFLRDNHIVLNETAGAAYQDIGFMHRVIMHANRAMFTAHNFYRYRTDREESSVNSVNGLRYAYQEFKTLIDNHEIKSSYIKRFYYTLARAFIIGGSQICTRVDESWKSEKIAYYDWFVMQIRAANEYGIEWKELLDANECQRLELLVNSLDAFCEQVRYPGNTKALSEKIGNQPIVLFGVGIRGKSLLKLFGDIWHIDALCDNNAEQQGKKWKGKSILSPKECVRLFPDHLYIITIKKCAEDIQKQLISYGINANQLLTYIKE